MLIWRINIDNVNIKITLINAIKTKTESINRKIVNRTTFYVTVSSVMAMIVGIGVVIAGFIALFMYIKTKMPPSKQQSGGEGQQNNNIPEKNNEKTPEQLEQEGKANIIEQMLKNMPKKPNATQNDDETKIEESSIDDNKNTAFQDLFNNKLNNNEEKKGHIQPTINETNQQKTKQGLNIQSNQKNIPKQIQNLDTINNAKNSKQKSSNYKYI